jgi:hypothetical protein
MSLSNYSHIRTALFVKMEVTEYLQSDGSFAQTDLLFSDHYKDYDLFVGETYTALGQLLNVSSSSSELTPSSGSLTLTISGIPDRSIEEIIKSKIKSSTVTINRAFFAQNGELINDGSTTNPVGRFNGFVSNYSLFEEWDAENRLSTNTIVFDCNSQIELLAKKTGGRKTNPTSMKKFYPTDTSFDRVPAIVNANINFGGPA